MTDTASAGAPRTRSVFVAFIDAINALCAVVPYAAIALAIRLVMARVFFLAGQGKIEGPSVPLGLKDFDFAVTLPVQVKSTTYEAFQTKFAAIPFPPDLAANFVSYAEFFLPILLVLGFATRLSAAILFVTTVVIQFYVLPEAFWTVHVFWGLLLLVLMSVGPGAASIDHVIRFLSSR